MADIHKSKFSTETHLMDEVSGIMVPKPKVEIEAQDLKKRLFLITQAAQRFLNDRTIQDYLKLVNSNTAPTASPAPPTIFKLKDLKDAIETYGEFS